MQLKFLKQSFDCFFFYAIILFHWKEKKNLNLSVGLELTKEQINALTSDIVWLVWEEINGVKVLVPKVYISEATKNNIEIQGNSIVAGKNIQMEIDSLKNNDTIKAGGTILVKAKDITNNGLIAGGNVALYSENNIINEGASISATDKLILDAKKDIVIKTKVEKTEELSAGVNTTVKNTSSLIQGGTVLIKSDEDINIIGSDVIAKENATISAKENVNILAAKDSTYSKTVEVQEALDIFDKTKVTTTEKYDETIVASNISGKNISIKSGNDVNIIGSNLINDTSDTEEKGNINIQSLGNVTIAEAREVHLENVEVKESGFKLSFDKDNFILKAGIEQTITTTNSLNDLARGSELSGGNIATEGKNITLQGAIINANSNVDFSAEESVSILEAKDISKTESKTETTFTGLTLTLNQDLVNLDKSFKAMLDLPKALKGNISSILNGGFGAIDGLRGTANAINAVPDVSANGKSGKGNDANSDKMSVDKQAVKDLVSVSFGITRTTEESKEVSETSVASNINAQNIKINSKKDTTIQGSNLYAIGNIDIEAENLNILASIDKTTSSNDSKTESLSVGIGIDNNNDLNLGGITGSLSKSESDSVSIKNTNSTLNAGGNLKITTDNDMTIKGGVVKADTVDLDIGNNLIVQSVQDTEKSKNNSFSASLTVSVGSGSANGSLDMQKGYVDNAWVTEQSGIYTTNGGTITVANNTELKGSVIASENKDKAIELDTKIFTYEDINDKQEGKTTGFGISGGTTGGVPATSVQYASNDKRQDTNATISNVNLTVNKEKLDPNTIGINTDITQAQVITKDERVDMIDVNLQTDLANKEERNKIQGAKEFIYLVIHNQVQNKRFFFKIV